MLADSYGNAITTSSQVARDHYDQGIKLLLEGNHGFIEAFEQAVAADDEVAEHEVMRLDAGQIRDLLKSADATAARLALDRLARRISHHEAAEEQLISRISE